jgi:hypothetical protein
MEEEIATVVVIVDRRRECFILYRENMQLLVITFAADSNSSESSVNSSISDNDSDSDLTDTSELWNWHSHLLNKTVMRCFSFRMDSSVKYFARVYFSLSLSHGMTSQTISSNHHTF